MTIMENEAQTPTSLQGQRPRGMTFILILSFINAVWKIVTSFISYFIIPTAAQMMESGQLQKSYQPILAMMKWGEDEIDAFMATLQSNLSVNVNYHLIVALLFIGSLVGVIMMLKIDKRGLHVYSIAQLCNLIAASVFLYPKQLVSSFVYDLLLTLMFIYIYYIYFKRIEMAQSINQDQNPEA